MINCIPNYFGIRKVSVTVPFRALCSIVSAPFIGKVTITYRPEKWCPEYGSVETFAESFRERSMTHEEVAATFLKATETALECPVRVDVWVSSAAHPDAWVVVGDETL